MGTTKIEYAAHYPFQIDDGHANTYYGPTEREDAESMVRYVNSRLRLGGMPEIATLVERKVTYSDWTPSNTGVVPPWMGGKDAAEH